MSQFKYAPGKFETVLLFTALICFVTSVVYSRCFVAGMKQLSEFNHYFGACDSTGQGWYEGISLMAACRNSATSRSLVFNWLNSFAGVV